MIVSGQNGGSLDGVDDRLPKTPVSAFMTPSKYDHEDDDDDEENDEAMLGRVYFVKTKLAGRRLLSAWSWWAGASESELRGD